MTIGGAIRRRNPARSWDEGATAVEAALIISVLVSLVLGIIEFGMALWSWNTMLLAIEDAGRHVMVKYASGRTCDTTCAESEMQSILTSASVSCPLPSGPAAGTWYVCASPNTGPPPTMTLSAAYGFSVVGLAGPLMVTSQATVPLE